MREQMLPEIVEALQRMVRADWPEMDVLVQGTSKCLLVEFISRPLCHYTIELLR
eukprot:SAG11_NODE_851_length_6875_cov_8.193034_6_plen_54_part_00